MALKILKNCSWRKNIHYKDVFQFIIKADLFILK